MSLVVTLLATAFSPELVGAFADNVFQILHHQAPPNPWQHLGNAQLGKAKQHAASRRLILDQRLAMLSTLSTIGSGLPIKVGAAHRSKISTKSRQSIYGASIRASAQRAKDARKEADSIASAGRQVG
jgi:hypothetical protein